MEVSSFCRNKVIYLSYKILTVLLEIDNTAPHGDFSVVRGGISSVLKEVQKYTTAKDIGLQRISK